ncbi:hypothetical protein [Altererythrobacter sp.]|uniref:hypothetical protein n=1 Tax=Altererythrobacter sp. TaxID=1872480 RepID=UPI003D0716CD
MSQNTLPPSTIGANPAQDGAISNAPLGGTRPEAIQRLQIGLSGIAAMLLLVGLASILQDRARVADEQSVPQAVPTTEPSAQSTSNDPLADAGVVPDLPVEPSSTPTQGAALMPEEGTDAIGAEQGD